MSFFAITWSLQVQKILPPITRDLDFIANGSDFLTGDPSPAYIERFILSSPGHWKEFPKIGVNIWSYLHSTQSPQVLRRNILLQLMGDVFSNPIVDIRNYPTILINDSTFQINV